MLKQIINAAIEQINEAIDNTSEAATNMYPPLIFSFVGRSRTSGKAGKHPA